MPRIADSHSDYASFKVLSLSDNRLFDHGGIENMLDGGVKLQVLAVWIPQEQKHKIKCCFRIIDFIYSITSDSNEKAAVCTNKDDDDNKLRIIIMIESADSINCRIDMIKKVYDRGVRILSLTWNEENRFASGCCSAGGLKAEGLKAIKEINRLRMALDVSHLNEQGFWESIEIYKYPPCATHSSVYDIAPNPRNLKKDQIKHLISKDGYIGINFYTEFLKGRYADIEDILEHIEYILSLGGEKNVGLGSDFCGIQYTPKGLDSSADFQKIPEAMAKRNYSDTLINQICYGNFEEYILKFL